MDKRTRQVLMRLTRAEATQILALARLRCQSVGALVIDLAAPVLATATKARGGLLLTNDNADGRNPSAFGASQAGAGDALTSIAHDAPEGGRRATR